MEAVCCRVGNQVTSLSHFCLAPLRVSHSFLSIFHLYLFSLSILDTLSAPRPHLSFCPHRRPRLILPESWPSEPDENPEPCVRSCESASAGGDEIWTVKYECGVMLWCRAAVSLRQRWWKQACTYEKACVVLFCITFTIHLGVILAIQTHTDKGPGFKLHWL